ncbi:MAG: reverse transcriptase domain-containing protein [Sedimenticola sp.]
MSAQTKPPTNQPPDPLPIHNKDDGLVVKGATTAHTLSDEHSVARHSDHVSSMSATIAPTTDPVRIYANSAPDNPSFEANIAEKSITVQGMISPSAASSIKHPHDSNAQHIPSTIHRVTRSEGMYIEAQVEDVNVIFAIDTGASKTVISKTVYLSIPEDRRPTLRKTTGLTGASGKPLGQYGTAMFTLKIGSAELLREIIVADIEDAGLLGHDVLQDGNATIHYGDGMLNFMGSSIPCMQVGGSPKARKVRAADHFVIPSRCEAVIDVFVDGSMDYVVEANTILIEPLSTFQEKYNVVMASGISDTHSNVTHKVRIMNPGTTDVSINQDVIVGTAEPIVGDPRVLVTMESENDIGNLASVRRLQMADLSTKRQISTIRRVQQIVPEHLKSLYETASIGRPGEEKERIATTLINFQESFSKDEYDLGLTNLIEHSIDVGGHVPIKQPPRRVPLAFAAEEENVIKEMQKQGIIRPSTSPWASPICLVKKKSGKIRPCIDYRRVNAITTKDAYPLPRISDCLDAVAGACFFSTFDLLSGFHQIPIKQSDIPITAFCTKYGLYEYLSMPMGLTNSPATFQRLMEIALRGLQWHTCLIYLDDILVFGTSFDEHMDRVDEVLGKICEAGLKLRADKTQLLQTEVTFLGHKVSADGILPNAENIVKVQQWPIPTTVTHVRQILGLGSYYRRFIKGYSDLVHPLTQITLKGTKFVWSVDCQKAFDDLKAKLVGSDVMAHPRNYGTFILDTDASDTQIAGVLSQVQDGKERVVSYGSRTLNKAERNYCITDKELLAVRHFVEYYRQYLLGRRFLVRSDHQALTFLFRMKEPKGRIARWIEILSAFDFSIDYRCGPKHGNADAVSRCPDPWDCQCQDTDNLETFQCGPCPKCIKRFNSMAEKQRGQTVSHSQVTDDMCDTIEPSTARSVTTRSMSDPVQEPHTTNFPDTVDAGMINQWISEQDMDKIRTIQHNDPDLKYIVEAMKTGVRPPHSDVVSHSPPVRYYWSIWKSLTLHHGCLHRHFYRQDNTGSHLQFVVPGMLKKEILYQMHNNILSAHLGQKKTLEKTLQRFYWYGVRDDVSMWVRHCDTCAAIKKPHRTPRAPLGRMLVGAPLDRLATDILGPLPLTPRGNRYVLLATDHFTKWVEIMAVPDQTATTCANRLLNDVISRFGCPLTLHSDQGRNYESSIFRELCRLLEVKKTRTSARNPKCNGQAERFNRTLLRMVKSYLRGEQENWDLNLGCLAAAYRATPHESTGLTPNLLMLGREVRLPAELVYGGRSSCQPEITSYGDYVDHLRTRMQQSHEIARKHLSANAQRQEMLYDARLSVFNFKQGDVVWVENEAIAPGLCAKLQPAYKGPCVIVHKFNDLTYSVQLNATGSTRVLHHNKMKPYEGTDIPVWIQFANRRLEVESK